MKNQFHTHLTPQSQMEPLDSRQVPNSEGGYVYAVDHWRQLRRFLIMGTTGGTFYINERGLTKQNVEAVNRCITENGLKVVDEVVKVSHEGLAYSNDPALFVLALAMTHGDGPTKTKAALALPRVARIPTHLFHFATYVQSMRGWGRVVKNAVSKWYTDAQPSRLALHLLKYQARDGWSHRDLVRLAHPKAAGDIGQMLRYAAGKPTEFNLEDITANDLFAARVLTISAAEAGDWTAVASFVRDYSLPREMLPTEALNHPEVWSALLDHMPVHALLRNLGNLAKHGVLDSRATAVVTSPDEIKRGRVHPLSVFTAMGMYSRGASRHGQWTPNRQMVQALEQSLNLAMKADAEQPLNKRVLVGVDISGSMDSQSSMSEHFTCAQLAGALACMLAAGHNADVILYDTSIKQLPQELLFTLSPMLWAGKIGSQARGGTNCALSVTYAERAATPYDAIINLTDNETWAGRDHAAAVYKKLHSRHGTKYVNVQMASNSWLVTDPNHPGVLEVVGFDVSALPAISAFIRGEV